MKEVLYVNPNHFFDPQEVQLDNVHKIALRYVSRPTTIASYLGF